MYASHKTYSKSMYIVVVHIFFRVKQVLIKSENSAKATLIAVDDVLFMEEKCELMPWSGGPHLSGQPWYPGTISGGVEG